MDTIRIHLALRQPLLLMALAQERPVHTHGGTERQALDLILTTMAPQAIQTRGPSLQ
jgi:hypothetical protein